MNNIKRNLYIFIFAAPSLIVAEDFTKAQEAFDSKRYMQSIGLGIKSVTDIFPLLVQDTFSLLPYTQKSVKNVSYSADISEGRMSYTVSLSYRYQSGGDTFTNALSYDPDQASYYFTYINGLQFFYGETDYKVIPIKTTQSIENYLWNTKDKTAVVVPLGINKEPYGIFIKVYFPKNSTNEKAAVEDLVSKINWTSLRNLFSF